MNRKAVAGTVMGSLVCALKLTVIGLVSLLTLSFIMLVSSITNNDHSKWEDLTKTEIALVYIFNSAFFGIILTVLIAFFQGVQWSQLSPVLFK